MNMNLLTMSGYCPICAHCKSKIVKITNVLVSTVARNNKNCNLIGHVVVMDMHVIII